ncbi:MAG TPA: oligosaccharide flippase family protein [Ferruginibacter sp.]|nr:oligosaccharide flippase family protein [Ferruginibacter sp.]
MRKNFIKDISSGTVQVVLNQGLGLLVFILISRYLEKAQYGEFNWTLAILTLATTILGLRLEQIVVRKVAAGDDPAKILTLFAGHSLAFGILFYLVLFFTSLLIPSFFKQHDLLLILAISQLLGFFSSPFKQLANGKEQFAWLAVMSSVSNLVKAVWILLTIFFSFLTIQSILIIYIVASLAELLFCLFVVRYKLAVSINSKYALKDYFNLLRESAPQIGSVFLNAFIARIDWILLGIFSGTIITAEYSFAYKLFELCPVPLLVLGPVLLSRFSKYLSGNPESSLLNQRHEISFFIRFEMIVATLIPLVLNIIWSPLIDGLTNNKYGEVNKITFFLLSLCIPFQYLINLFWTVEFAQNRLKRVFRITAVTGIIIVAGDLLMIPLWNARGAAIVYLLATVTEYLLYFRISVVAGIKESWQSLIVCVFAALAGGFAVSFVAGHILIQLLLSLTIYFAFLIITKQIKQQDLQLIKQWLYKKQPVLFSPLSK